MVSNCDQFSSSTIPMQCKSEYNSSNPNQKDYQPDDPPVTPWIRGDVIYEGSEFVHCYFVLSGVI
ncbi:unnamed protein product [Trichobilharzia regenti]|nr:unnamed protein product [Trichobilharzia regenti]